MRLLSDLHPCDPALGLALEDVLVDSARNDGLESVRIWRNRLSVIVGRSQSVEVEVDTKQAEALKCPILRRFSGGGTVLHYPGNLNISVAFRKRVGLSDVPSVFAFFGAALAEALAEIVPTLRCEENGLHVGDLKIGGAAQAHRGPAILYHTTLLVWPPVLPMEDLLLAMRFGYQCAGVPSRARSVTSLAEQLGSESIELHPIAKRIENALASCLKVPLDLSGWTAQERMSAEVLAAEKYRSEAWNRRL